MKTINKRFGAKKLIGTGYRSYSARRRISLTQLAVLALIICTGLFIGAYTANDATTKVKVQILSVADGDTIRVKFDNGSEETVRLLGIDTPETHHPTKPVGCFGPEAENFTRTSLGSKEVFLEYDVERKDRYDRTLAYVYLGDQNFNAELLRLGFAKVLTIEPNGKYASEFSQLQLQADRDDRGMWGYCKESN